MSVEYDSVVGYGIELKDDYFRLVFDMTKEEFAEEESYGDLTEFSTEDYEVVVVGCCVTCDGYGYYLRLKDMDLVGIEGRGVGMYTFLLTKGINEEPKFFNREFIY